MTNEYLDFFDYIQRNIHLILNLIFNFNLQLLVLKCLASKFIGVINITKFKKKLKILEDFKVLSYSLFCCNLKTTIIIF